MRQKAWVSQQRGSGPGQSRAGCGLHILNSLSDILNWDSAVGLTPPLFWHPTPQAKMFGFNNCSTKLYYEEWSWLSLKPQLLPAGEVSWGITPSSSSSDVRHTDMSFPGSPSYLILCGLSVAFGMAHHSPWFQGLSFLAFCSSLINSFLDIGSPIGRETCDEVLPLRDLVLHNDSS